MFGEAGRVLGKAQCTVTSGVDFAGLCVESQSRSDLDHFR